MKNKLLLSGLALFSLSATAQQLQEGDILWPNSQKLYQYVQNWTPGQPVKIASATDPNPSTNGIDFEDENFFVSRVKMKPYFRHSATQVDESLTEANDKRLVNWVPVNKANDGHTDGLPNGLFDSEVFSNWSYVTHWGDWISPHGWVPASFADAAHKHGVAVSGVASVPYGSIGGDWSTALSSLAGFNNNNTNKEKLAKFLYFHGVDGLGYNSEFSGFSSTNLSNLQNLHKYLEDWYKEKGHDKFENMWYDGTNDNGAIQFDNGLTANNDGNFSGASLFLNYNWNSSSLLSKSVTYAQNTSRKDPLYLYAGHNMQGGQPGSNNWALLAQYPVSIGLWGAHNTNLLWAQRSANGSAPVTMQDTYQKRNEQWFTNGVRNPVKRMRVYNRSKFSPDVNWFGMSVYMSARSSLCWSLADEPFISYFNLGNGTFLNWKGERKNNNEWYNIGVQDYMPTWRWWFTDKFLSKNADDVPATGLDAQFTWNDAWVGGSCLNVFGSTDEEYLHLFKTKFGIEAGDKITVRYKLVGGKANANLIFSVEGDETSPIEYPLFDTTQEVDDDWLVSTFTVAGRDDIANQTIAMIALGFEEAQDMNLYIGELSIVRNQTPTPNKPEIKVAKVLRNNYHGVDAKIVFNMANDKESTGEPCYNLDVNTSMFKLYARVDGETKLMGLTSSWAGMYFSIPVGEASTVELGVSAVSTDMESESEIAWSTALPVGERTVSNDVVVSQPVIKPNESFTVGYLDPAHEVADWELTNANTSVVVKTATGTMGLEFPDGLTDVAPYNLKVTEKGGDRVFNWFVQITDDAAGAMPKIYSISLNDAEEEVTIESGESVNVAYTGRNADGAATRAISAEEVWIGGNLGKSGLDLNSSSFTVAAWINYTYAASNGSSAFFSIEDRTVAWPQNNWGWFWSNLNEDGTIGSFTFRTSYTGGTAEIKYTFPDTKVSLGLWTHVAIVFDFQSTTSMRAQLYINGIKQSSRWECASGSSVRYAQSGTTDDYCTYPNGQFRPEANMWYSFFGGRGEGYVAGNGMVDDLQLWDKALSAEEVVAAMSQTRDDIPANLRCYWDFESDNELDPETGYFTSLGQDKEATAANYALVAADAEGQAKPTPQMPAYLAGNPFLEGSGYPVVTQPTWTGRRASVSEATGTGESGSAKVTYTKAGEYTLTLTLANAYGSDTRDYPLVTVEDPVGVEETAAEGELRTYTVDDALFVAFAADGNYEVSVYNISGALVAQKAQASVAGQTMRITLGTSGVYVVRVVKDGKEAKAFKVMKK